MAVGRISSHIHLVSVHEMLRGIFLTESSFFGAPLCSRCEASELPAELTAWTRAYATVDGSETLWSSDDSRARV